MSLYPTFRPRMNRLNSLLFVFVLAGYSSRIWAGPTNFVVILAEAQGWANTSVAMDVRNPASRSRQFTTPAVERLAHEGMRFAYGYAASPRCTPSRAALLTGKNPATLHMTYVGAGRNLSSQRTALLPPEVVLELPTEEITLGERLRAAGYATAHFGKWHVGRADPSRHGFQESDGPTSNGGPDNVANPNPQQAPGMTERGIAFMTRAQASGQPFYLQLSHYPDQSRKERGREREREPISGPTEPEIVDLSVSHLLEALDRLGLTGSTYIFYTADHGSQGRVGNQPLSGGKGAVTEGGLRVPFLVRGPGIATNICSRVPVIGCDLLPTVLELSGIPVVPAGVEGGSLVPVLFNPEGQGTVRRPREELVFHFPHYDLGNGGPATALVLGPYKLIRNYERDSRQLFDLEKDPAERRDLSGELPGKVKDMENRLTRYLQEVGAQMPRPNPNQPPANRTGEASTPTDPGSNPSRP